MVLKEALNSILLENNIKGEALKKAYYKLIYNIQLCWIDKYSDDEPEVLDPSYMESEMKRSGLMKHDPYIPFILNQPRIKGSENPEDVQACHRHGCFYNSVLYYQQNKENLPNLKLCFGYVVQPRFFDALTKSFKCSRKPSLSAGVTKHAFLRNGDIILDPTFRVSDYYYYKDVPEEKAESFRVDPDDSNYNAGQFFDYVYDEFEKINKAYKEEMVLGYIEYFNKKQI